MRPLSRDEIKLAQSQIAAVDSGIKVDGVWGPKTQKAYTRLAPAMRDLVDSTMPAGVRPQSLVAKPVIRVPKPPLPAVISPSVPSVVLKPKVVVPPIAATIRDYTPDVPLTWWSLSSPLNRGEDEELARRRKAESSAVTVKSVADKAPASPLPKPTAAVGRPVLVVPTAVTLSKAAAREIVIQAAREEDVPVETALKICTLESAFNHRAVSPTGFKGLFQLGTEAMTDVRNYKSSDVRWTPAGSNRRGPLFRMTDPFDARENALVGMRYIKLCARRMNVQLTDVPPLYMAFNIGSTGAKNVLNGNPHAAAAQIAANPAYGGGNPSKYYAALVSAVRNA